MIYTILYSKYNKIGGLFWIRKNCTRSSLKKIIPFWQGKMDLIHDGFYGRRDKIPLLIRAA